MPSDKKLAFLPAILLLLLSTAIQGLCANYYVRKGAVGTNKGTDWNNAWNEMNQINFAALNCGDTVWLAGGAYATPLRGNASCSAGKVLTFQRVLPTDSTPASAAGWSSSFDSLVSLQTSTSRGPQPTSRSADAPHTACRS